MPVIWGEFDIDIPFTNPNPYPGDSGIPFSLNSTGPAYYAYPIGSWSVGYRGSIYFKFKNNAVTEKTLSISAGVASGEAVLQPAAETVFELNLASIVADFPHIAIGGESIDVQILDIQLTPFTAEVFWTNLQGVTEIP